MCSLVFYARIFSRHLDLWYYFTASVIPPCLLLAPMARLLSITYLRASPNKTSHMCDLRSGFEGSSVENGVEAEGVFCVWNDMKLLGNEDGRCGDLQSCGWGKVDFIGIRAAPRM